MGVVRDLRGTPESFLNSGRKASVMFGMQPLHELGSPSAEPAPAPAPAPAERPGKARPKPKS